MLTHGSKINSCWIIIIVIGFLILVNIGTVEASRRALNFHAVMEKSMVRHRRVEIHRKYFDVYINLDKKSIKVRGEVEDWEEKDEVEEYFKQRNPFNCPVICEIDIIS